MVAFPDLYLPLGDWIQQCHLHPANGLDESALMADSSSSNQKNPVVSSTSNQKLSSISSTPQYSGPSTPGEGGMGANNAMISYFRQTPVTPISDTGVRGQQPSPCVYSNMSGQLVSSMNLTQCQWHPIGYFAPNDSEVFRSEASTPIRTRGSFVSDASSFSSPTSIEEYSSGDLQRGLWTIGGLQSRTELFHEHEQPSISLPQSFDSTIWDDSFLNSITEDTVNPSDTVAASQEVRSPCEDQEHSLAPISPVEEPLGQAIINAPMTSSGQQDDIWDCVETSSERSEGPSPETSSSQGSPLSRRASKRRSKRSSRARSPSSGLPTAVFVYPKQKLHCNYPGCGSKFSRREHLTRHDKVHTNERPYKCSLAHYGGDQWHKAPKPGMEPEDGYSRADNQRQHYITHLKAKGKATPRNKCAEKMFLYFCIWKHERERAPEIISLLEKALARLEKASKWKHNQPVPEYELQEAHVDWPEYSAWLKADGSLESLVYREGQEGLNLE